ncbi:LysE family translocator [Aliagarivorans taiwanensis]|uniref:LysE family translocator n=1 Tax=Aliagarivorans taiwanensis TaxID=561966 RepID=UPI00040A31F7|nr:LysE family translocator [Aliagarivorans taiwanensis]
MDWNTLSFFLLASLTLNLIPGPDVVYIVSHSMHGKLSRGLTAALGLGVGYLLHTAAAVLGLSALLLQSAFAFTVVKLLGAVYLVYLGLSALRRAYKGGGALSLKQSAPASHNAFHQGVIVSILNPKVALFFLSFLPQFINLEQANTTQQLLTLGLVFTLLATVVNSSYALLGSWLFSRANRDKLSRIIEGASGGLLLLLAGRLATNQ